MTNQITMDKLKSVERAVRVAEPGDELLGPLKQLPGVWKNEPGLEGRGWNMIALPFIPEDGGPDYRILMNQYNEELKFSLIDTKVPNRGVSRTNSENKDQLVVTLDYKQVIDQIAAEDSPNSGLAGDPKTIHHEPGLFLNMLNFNTDSIDIGRLGTIPHGNSVLALGTAEEFDGPPVIPNVNTLPIGATTDVDASGYLAPYKHFRDFPFQGIFNVLEPDELLRAATPTNVVKTNKLEMSTTLNSGGIVNIPFIDQHADASEMTSTFWIMETDELEANGEPVYIMQYMQVVMLDFFERFDSEPGLIKWPHVSFNTMRRFPLKESKY